MSLIAIRPYFRTHCDALGFTEWTDGFNFENIPSTILDRTYHIGAPSVSGVSNNQADQVTESSIDIKVFFKGYNDPASGIDTAVLECENIIKEVVSTANRVGGDIKNVTFESMSFDPLNASNDNHIMVTLSFNCLVILPTD